MKEIQLEDRSLLFENYSKARQHFLSHPTELIGLERYLSDVILDLIIQNKEEIERDYNEATVLLPFWANYPPEDRGRAPVGDQVPWIEVGEHSVGDKLTRLASALYGVREVGLPSGADDRFVFSSDRISEITKGYTNSAFLFLDIKSVGPRDDADHTVLSPYQVSGDGCWSRAEDNLMNSPMRAVGRRSSYEFFPAISPIYALSDGTIAPVVHIFVKPVYGMVKLQTGNKYGQPLQKIVTVCVPNGLLLSEAPGYLHDYPTLFFPGKDIKEKDPKKKRVRVSFAVLREIDSWRFSSVEM